MTIAQDVAAILADALGTSYVVRPYRFVPDGKEPGKRYVSVQFTGVSLDAPDSGGRLPEGSLRHDHTIAILSSHDDPKKAEPDLVEATLATVEVLRTDVDLQGLQWTDATRTAVADEFHAFEIQTWCISTGTGA